MNIKKLEKTFLIYPYWNINIKEVVLKPENPEVSNLSILEYKYNICIKIMIV